MTSIEPAKQRVLIVDDHPLVRCGLAALIEGEPDLAVCGEAATATEALALVCDMAPDAVIADLSLPDNSGVRLIERLAGLEHPPRILVFSMYEESLFASRSLSAGASGYLNKHEAGLDVIEALRHILAGKVYLSRQMTETMVQGLANGGDALAALPSIGALSNRELEVFRLIGDCLSASQIAERLNLSVKTVETHRAKIKRKLKLTDAGELRRFAVQWALEQR